MPNLPKVYFKRLDNQTSEKDINNVVLSLWQKSCPEDFIKDKSDFVAIKLTFGEEETTGYIKSSWLSNLIQYLKHKTENLFILETNTLYREKRSNAVGHLSVAYMHGYDIQTTTIPIIIGDGLKGLDSQNVNVHAEHFESVKLAKAICESDSIICLSHVTGHCQTGFAGCLKNLGMGCSARAGKLLQHSKTLPEITVKQCTGCSLCVNICPVNAIAIIKKKAIIVKERCIGCGECTVICDRGAIEIKYDENVVRLQEKMVEYALGVRNVVNSNMMCMNFLLSITKNCDCMSKKEAPFCNDIGIMAGNDPVAIDKASLDIIGIDNFKNIHPSIDPLVQIYHAEKIKLGISKYELIEL